MRLYHIKCYRIVMTQRVHVYQKTSHNIDLTRMRTTHIIINLEMRHKLKQQEMIGQKGGTDWSKSEMYH